MNYVYAPGALTFQQRAAYAAQAGFTGEAIVTIVAISERESRGVPSVVNRSTTENWGGHVGCASWGLTQINVCPGVGQPAPEHLLDPLANMRAAFTLSKGGTDFGPWGVGPHAYRSGVAAPPIESVRAELASGTGNTPPDAGARFGPAASAVSTDSPTQGIADGLHFFTTLGEWTTWRRVLYIVAGGLAIGLGIGLISEDTSGAVSKATKSALKGATMSAGEAAGTIT